MRSNDLLPVLLSGSRESLELIKVVLLLKMSMDQGDFSEAFTE